MTTVPVGLSVTGDAGRLRRVWLKPVVLLAFAALLLLPQLAALASLGEVLLEDDALYYLVIARNIAEMGRSTFDGQSLTNGYHPLWQLLTAVQVFLLGDRPVLLVVMEAALLIGALWLLLDIIGGKPIVVVSAAALLVLTLDRVTMRGMEASLAIACYTLLLWMVARRGSEHQDDRREGFLIGLAAAAAIGARLDSAVFVLPFLAMALKGSLRLTALAAVAALGAVYAVAGYLIFDGIMPVSASVKSLGGLQVNWTLLAQLRETYPAESIKYLFLLGLCGFLAGRHAGGTWQRAALLSCTFGLALFAGKLLLGSSWRVWDWYFYPIPLAALTVMATELPRLTPALQAHDRRVLVAAVTALSLWAASGSLGTAMTFASGRDYTNFRHISRLAVERYADVLRGARVAMGDRAGSFAYAYRGGVVQTEGLVNDRAYFRALAGGGDIRGLLCARGVEFLVDFERDLGAYAFHEVETLKPGLTSLAAPRIRVEAKEEVSRVYDLSRFRLYPHDPGNAYLYIWRLGC